MKKAICLILVVVLVLGLVSMAVASLVVGIVFVMRVGGADMPITISLLNAFISEHFISQKKKNSKFFPTV